MLSTDACRANSSRLRHSSAYAAAFSLESVSFTSFATPARIASRGFSGCLLLVAEPDALHALQEHLLLVRVLIVDEIDNEFFEPGFAVGGQFSTLVAVEVRRASGK